MAMKLAPEGWAPAGILAAVAVVAAWWHPTAGAAILPLLAFTLWFFRDPVRSPPEGAAGLLAPADGRVIVAGPRKVSIFMNVFDVHVCRAPVGGRVDEVTRTPGRFLAAYREPASEQNERTSIVIAAGDSRVRFTLVAGLVARRIVCRVKPGQQLAAGERVGIIRFGSRVDVFLPEGAKPAIRVGDRVTAGETPIARFEPAAFPGPAGVREGRGEGIPI